MHILIQNIKFNDSQMNNSSDSLPQASQGTFLKKLLKHFKKNKKSISDKIVDIVNEETNEEGLDLDQDTKEILINVANFTDIIVEDISIPRSDIEHISDKCSLEELKNIFIKTRHTRIVIIGESLDDIKGFIHIKDILPYFHKENKFDTYKILKKPLFIPPSIKIADLALQMREMKTRLAIVVDEYGGTDGLVTMGDLMEEIVGEEEQEKHILKDKGNGKFEIGAKSKIEDIEKNLNIKLLDKKFDEEFDTIAGLIMSLNNHKIPKTGDNIEFNKDISFYIKEAEPRFIKRVIIEIKDAKNL